MDTEKQLIQEYEAARVAKSEAADALKKAEGAYDRATLAAEKSEKLMEKYYRRRIKKSLAEAKTAQDYVKIKESLIDMPYCAGKVLIFRTIIMTETERKAPKTKKSK